MIVFGISCLFSPGGPWSSVLPRVGLWHASEVCLMSAQGPTCCPKTRPSRSASYGRFATAESRQRFPFVPLAMPPRREEARTRDPADPGRCSRCAAALSRAADAPYAYRVACPRLCGRLSMPLAAISPHRRTRRRDVVIRTRQLCSKPLHARRRFRSMHTASP